MELIAAVDKNWAIGRGTELLVAISADLKRFRQLTTGKSIIYGRKTLESFPGSKPLPKRRNIILSRTLEKSPDYEVCRSYSELAALVEGLDDLVLVGGASVYTALEPFCTSAEITFIDYAFDDAEHFIPNFDQLEHWTLAAESERFYDENSGLYYTYRRYENQMPGSLMEMSKLDTEVQS